MFRIPILRMYFTALFFLLFQFQPVLAKAAEGDLSADEIMDRLLNQHEKNEKDKPKYTSKSFITIEKLDSDGKVDEIEDMVYQTSFIEGEEYWRLVKKNGAPLSEEEKEEEQEREAKFRKRQKDKKAGKESEEEEMSIALDRKTVERFKFKLVGTETINGRPAYHLFFEPDRSKDLSEKKDVDRFLNACEGDLYVDIQDFEFARVKMRLTKTVRFGLGLLAYFKKGVFMFEQAKRASGEWLPSSSRVYIWGRTLLLKPIRQRHKLRFTNFKKQ